MNGSKRWAGVVATCFFAAGVAHAQLYPAQPIRLIVPWPPGGGVDTSAREVVKPSGAKVE